LYDFGSISSVLIGASGSSLYRIAVQLDALNFSVLEVDQ